MKKHSFKITIESDDPESDQTPVSFLTHNHDDLLKLIQRVEMNTDAELSQFLGIKLFGEAMLDDRKNPLYEDISPLFGQFMKKYKALRKSHPARVS